MNKYWPKIKFALYCVYVVLIWTGAVASAYMGMPLTSCVFLIFFALNLLEGGLNKIAEAIRTQRNFHVIGDGNDIHLAGASLHADHVTVNKSGVQ